MMALKSSVSPQRCALVWDVGREDTRALNAALSIRSSRVLSWPTYNH